MPNIPVHIPGRGQPFEGDAPIVILGPNGSGKTRLAHGINGIGGKRVSAVSAQRRTWVDDSLPVQEETQLRSEVTSRQNNWRTHPWAPIEDLSYLLSQLIQEHTSILTTRNEEAIDTNSMVAPTHDTNLIRLQALWKRVFPQRELRISGFFPRVVRSDGPQRDAPYSLRNMSDGERTVLYMTARAMTAETGIILVDEPELHMHSRLAVQYWDEVEALRPDCRFVYITHDLTFALSRKRASIFSVGADGKAALVDMADIQESVAPQILGAATLPFYAKRVFFFEGESGRGFASELFSTWFNDGTTFAIPSGNRSSVCAAVIGLKKVGVVAAEVLGLVDRDFYSDDVIARTTEGVSVLPLHEIESVVCDREVIAALAHHLGKDPATVLAAFQLAVRKRFQGSELNNLIAQRVRARVGDLMSDAFGGDQIRATLPETVERHVTGLTAADFPARTRTMFEEERVRITNAIATGDEQMLAILPGKHLVSLLSSTFGFAHTAELTGLMLEALRAKPESVHAIAALGHRLEGALGRYLPPRTTA